MPEKDWFDDFTDYKLSCSGTGGKTGVNDGCLLWFVCVVAVLWVIVKLFG